MFFLLAAVAYFCFGGRGRVVFFGRNCVLIAARKNFVNVFFVFLCGVFRRKFFRRGRFRRVYTVYRVVRCGVFGRNFFVRRGRFQLIFLMKISLLQAMHITVVLCPLGGAVRKAILQSFCILEK